MRLTVLFVVLSLITLFSARMEALESPPESGIEAAASSSATLKDWEILKKAEKDLSQGQTPHSLNKIEDQSALAFYRDVLKARGALRQNQVLEALNLLQTLPRAPEIELSENQVFFRKVYREALLTKKKALDTLGKDASEPEQLLWAYFPDLESPPAVAPMPRGANGFHFMNRLHALFVRKEWNAVLNLAPSQGSLVSSGLSAEQRCQLHYEWAEAARQAKKQDLALQGFSSVSGGLCEGEKLNRSLYWKAKFEAGAKKYDQAIRTYEEAIRHFPSGRYTDDAYYALAGLYESVGDKSKALAARNHLMGLSKGDMKAKVLWEEGYQAYKKKQYSQAVENFERILSMSAQNDESHPQALYWKARALDQQKKGQGRAQYQRVMSEYPFSFYAVLAAHRLGSSPSPIPARKISGSGGGETLGLVDALNKEGRHSEALEVLDYFAQTNQERAGKDLVLMSAKLLESGDYHRAMMLAHRYFDSSPSSAVFDRGHSMIAALFPLVYPDAVRRSAQESGLARGVIEGIMREESLFQPSVVSHAGAIGLMQLMPGTASMQAAASGVSDFSVSRLDQPTLNITLGAQFFAKMIRQFDGQIPLAIMAYNAGPGNVRKWLNANGHLPLDEFVEEIPFSETRGYVKRVLRSIQVYGLLHNEDKLKKTFISFNLKK